MHGQPGPESVPILDGKFWLQQFFGVGDLDFKMRGFVALLGDPIDPGDAFLEQADRARARGRAEDRGPGLVRLRVNRLQNN